MTTSPITTKPLETPIPIQAKLAAAWTSFMFLYVYVDYLQLYKPGFIKSIQAGVVFQFEVTAGFAIIALTLTTIPIAMILLSLTLSARANRVINLVVGSLLIPYMVFNAADAGSWLSFYVLAIVFELAVLAFIVGSAWRWPRASDRAAEHSADRRVTESVQ